MNCDRVLTLIEEYFDGELGGPDLQLVEAHVAGCAACSVVPPLPPPPHPASATARPSNSLLLVLRSVRMRWRMLPP